MSDEQDRNERAFTPRPTPHQHPFDEATSALQKAIRRGQSDDAVYWVLQLAAQYEDYCWRRLATICTEDVGLGDPDMMGRIQALRTAAKELTKKPEQRANRLSHLVLATMLLARAPKSRIVDDCLTLHMATMDDPRHRREVPNEALDRHTREGRLRGRGWGAFFESGAHLENSAPIDNPYELRIRAHFAERIKAEQLRLEDDE